MVRPLFEVSAMTKPIKYYDPVFKAEVELSFDVLEGKFSAYTDTVETVSFKGKNEIRRIKYVVRLANRKDFYGLLHECVHLVKAIFRDRGIPFTGENDEVIAYYMNFWFVILWRGCHK